MSLNTTLAAPQTSLLAAPQYAGEVLVSLFANRVVFAGQITSDLSTGNWAQFNYGSVSVGVYTSVKEFQCLLIGATNDIAQATFYGRVRKVPTSSIMYSNESSQNFSVGAYFWVIYSWMPQYRLSRPSTDDPLTAVELVDYDIPYQPMLPAVVGLRTGYAGYVSPSTGYLRLGFDLSQSFAGESGATIASYAYGIDTKVVVAGAVNQAILIVDIPYGEQWGAASVTDSAGRVQTRRFGLKVHDPTLYPPDTGFGDGSIENHLEQGLTFSVPAFTGVDGVLPNTCCIVWRNNLNEMYNGTVQSLYGGGSAAVTNKVLTSQTATLTATAHPFAVGQTVIVADVGTQFNGTFVITATTANTFSYHSAQANVGSTGCSGMAVVNPNNLMFVGWLQSEDDPVRSDPTHTVIATTNFKFTGVGPRMARRARQLLALINTASPTRWGDINSLNPWRAILHYLQRYTTVATLCDITFSQTDSQYLFPAISTDGQNMLDVVKGIATQINALPAFAPDGRIAIDRDITYLSAAERTAQVTNVANWTSDDALTDITLSRDPDPDIGYTDAVGSFYNTATSQVVTLTARAPGIALGDAPGSNALPAQILSAGVDVLAAIDELAARAGGLFKLTNLKEFIEGDHPDGYSAVPFIPSRSQTYTWTISDSEWGPNNVNRYDYDTSVLWVVDSASYGFKRDVGRITNRVKYRRVVPTGDPGDNTTKNVPAPDSIPDVSPDLGSPAFNFDAPEIYFPDIGLALSDVNPAYLTNPPGKVATFNGSELVVWNTTQIFYEKNFIALTRPIPVDITPPDLVSRTIRQAAVDPYFTYSAIPLYRLDADGTDSVVSWNPNIANPGASGTWQVGGNVNGTFTVLRVTKTQGAVMIYSPDAPGGSATQSINFRTTSGGFVAEANYAGNSGQWVSTVGWQAIRNQATVSSNGCTLDIDLALGAVTIVTGATMTYNLTKGSGDLSGLNNGLALYSGGTSGTLVTSQYVASNEADGTGKTISLTPGSYTCDTVHIQLRSAFVSVGVPFTDGSAVLTGLTITATTSAGAQVAISFTFGGTFLTPVTVGATPGSSAGFDVQRSGGNSFAAIAGAVARATALGGAYSSYYSITGGVQAACIIVPYYTWSGALNTSNANPDILVGLTAPDGSSRTLLWIEGGATPGTVHNLTPVASFVFSNPNSITCSYQHHIIVTGTVSGVAKCYRTTDRGATWSLVSTTGPVTFVRTRRNDARAAAGSGTNKGQCYIMDNGTPGYTSTWASAGFYPRTPPVSLIGLDTVY